MNINKYLEHIKKIDSKIANKEYEAETWRDIAEGLSGSNGGERVQGSGEQQKLAEAVAKYTDIEEEIKYLKWEKDMFLERIEKLPEDCYNLMHDKYIKKISLKEIAQKNDRLYEWATSKHSRAKRLLKEYIEGENNG